MSYATLELKKAADKAYYKENRGRILKRAKLYQATYKVERKRYLRKTKRHHSLKHKAYIDKHKEQAKLERDGVKTAIINMYSNGEACCAVCRIADEDVLCLDHIENDGYKHVDGAGVRIGGTRLYRLLCKQDYPAGFQVLCANCNLKKEITRKRVAKCLCKVRSG